MDIRIRGQDELDELIASMTAAQEAIGPISAAAADAQTSFAPLIGIIEVIARLFGALPGPIQSVVTIGGTLGVVTLGLNFLLGAQGGLLFSTVIPAMVSLRNRTIQHGNTGDDCLYRCAAGKSDCPYWSGDCGSHHRVDCS